MTSSAITVRVSAKLKRRITASARKAGKSPHRWTLEVLESAASADEVPEKLWDAHWDWLRRHGRKVADEDIDRLIRESRNR